MTVITNMKELFLYRIRQAEKPSKKEKYIRKVMMWVVVDIVFLALAVSLFNEALHATYTVVIERSEAREKVGQNIPSHEVTAFPLSDDRGVKEGEVSPDPLLTIKKVAQEEGVDWKVLYAIGQKESQYQPNRIGDTHLPNPSIGYFQINTWYHKEVTRAQANDLEWSARWTAKRLKKNEWRGESEMIRSHNGLVANHSNDWYVEDVKTIIASL